MTANDSPSTTEDNNPSPAWRRPSIVITWLWFIGKNVLGWLLILAAMVLGPLVPGPGGIPLFIFGFALITFPGKRALTARVLRGRMIDPTSRGFQRGAFLFAANAPAGLLIYAVLKKDIVITSSHHVVASLALYFAAAMATYAAAVVSDGAVNLFLHIGSRIRRKVRPWLRHHGIDLLPPRRRHRKRLKAGEACEPDPEILELRDVFHSRLRNAWHATSPWLQRLAAVAIAALIFYLMFRPVAQQWDGVRTRILSIHWTRFAAASAMFAGFLLVFRVTSWRWIIQRFGYHIPFPAAMRVWSTSEMARYMPGVVWQMVGRAYLCRPYGIRPAASTASQIIELTIFLLANVLVAIACLLWLGIRSIDGHARAWLTISFFLLPVLVFFLHPKVLLSILNWAMRRLGREQISHTIGFGASLLLLGWAVLGLLWQSFAIWYLVSEPLGLPIAKVWVVAGAYCLAWIAGFLMILSPGGIGMRELVFVAAMRFALPPRIIEQFENASTLSVLLAFLSVVLRLWTVVGELILGVIAYTLDFRGAFGTGNAAQEGSDATSEASGVPRS